MKSYDVIIVGAGVAGLKLAELLSSTSLKVLLVDRRKNVRVLENHRYGTFARSVSENNLEDCIINKYDVFSFGTQSINDQTSFQFSDSPFVTVDYNIFAKRVNLNCEIKNEYTVSEVLRTPSGITIRSETGDEYQAKLIVDCSGNAQIISKKLGRKEHGQKTDFFNASIELNKCNIPDDMLHTVFFVTDFRYSNIAFWLYPYSKDQCQLGQAQMYSPTVKLPDKHEETIYAFMKNVEPYKTWFSDSEVIEKIYKPSSTTITRSLVDDNLITCGEAGGATTPVIGEGFRIALNMANEAHEAIVKAFANNDFSKEALGEYDQRFKKTIGRYYITSRLLRFILLRYIDMKTYDLFARNLKKLSHSECIAFIESNITWRIILKLLSPPFTLELIKNMYSYHIRGEKFGQRKELINE